MLVVSHAHAGATKLADEREIFFLLGAIGGPAAAHAALVIIHAMEVVSPAVKDQPAVWIDANVAKAQRLGELINHLPAIANLNGHMIKVRIASAVPSCSVGTPN